MRFRPRRTRCSACDATHVLLPDLVLPRRADAVEVIGAGLQMAAGGLGHRPISRALGVAAATVRGWLRRFAANKTIVDEASPRIAITEILATG